MVNKEENLTKRNMVNLKNELKSMLEESEGGSISAAFHLKDGYTFEVTLYAPGEYSVDEE